jgi:DNA-binding XRE family transcriptional regulator
MPNTVLRLHTARYIGHELFQWRTRMGYTQVAAANALRVPHRTLERWETAGICMHPDAILLLAWFIEGSPPDDAEMGIRQPLTPEARLKEARAKRRKIPVRRKLSRI